MADTAGEARDSAPVWQVPEDQLVTIEYPGVVGPSADSLQRALATLSPHAGPLPGTSSAPSALRHLAHVLALGGKLIECRLAPCAEEEDDPLQMYRHPVLGDIVPSHALVVRIERRMWRRTRPDGSTEEHKEYKVGLLGAVRATVRFRRMADFAFRPELPANAPTHPTADLHRALVQMDVDVLRKFRFTPENEAYTLPSGRSDLAMIPPPLFSRMELPFNYGYRQNPASSLQTEAYASTAKRARRTARKGETGSDVPEPGDRVLTRYLNRARWRNLAPIALKFGEATAVPTEPEAALARAPLSERHRALLERLQAEFAKRPVWSRLSLLNQFSAAEARACIQAKELFALTAYTFADGPWRDTLIRFGYDPRLDVESRLYVASLTQVPTHPPARKNTAGAGDTRRVQSRVRRLDAGPPLLCLDRRGAAPRDAYL